MYILYNIEYIISRYHIYIYIHISFKYIYTYTLYTCNVYNIYIYMRVICMYAHKYVHDHMHTVSSIRTTQEPVTVGCFEVIVPTEGAGFSSSCEPGSERQSKQEPIKHGLE